MENSVRLITKAHKVQSNGPERKHNSTTIKQIKQVYKYKWSVHNTMNSESELRQHHANVFERILGTKLFNNTWTAITSPSHPVKTCHNVASLINSVPRNCNMLVGPQLSLSGTRNGCRSGQGGWEWVVG